MIRGAVLALICILGAPLRGDEPEVKVGSKKFTESVVLGEVVKHVVESTGLSAEHRAEIGGTRILWNALLKGEIDIYPEYTGTISQEILAGEALETEEHIRRALAARGILMGEPLGFNNTYAIGMREDVAAQRDIRTISDLRRHPQLRFGFGNEFMDRGDGWPSLRDRYGLPQREVRGLDHDLAYRGLESGSIEAMDMYSTDAEIRYYKLRALEDDLGHFPVYNAVLVYRAELAERAPDLIVALQQLSGRISEAAMVDMNARVKIDRVAETQVAADFLEQHFALEAQVQVESPAERLVRHLGEHLYLVGVSLLAAIAIAVPLGVAAARHARFGQFILGAVGIIQTVPSLALLVFMIPLFGLGATPAIVALFLYSLLPIVRNTYTGLHDIPPSMIEAATALGLPPGVRLRLVELPLAARAILAGIKTSVVINVGTATLGAFIGAGGLGQLILTGIRLDNTALIMQGAVPAALLALLAQGLFEVVERVLVPRGLRLKGEAS